MAEPAIAVERLEVVRGDKLVLPGVSLSVAAGEVTGLLGPSGSGKSTLMRAIAGVQVVRAGLVSVLGTPAGTPSLRRRVAYTTQAPSVYGDLSARENLRYFARLLDVPHKRVEEVADAVRLDDVLDRPVSTLSGGQRGRVSLATALLGDPEVLVLDEPTVGLDPVLRVELWQTFAELAKRGATLLISSHVMDEAAFCDRLLLLREGAVIAAETPQRLLAETGASDLAGAFLELIEREERGT